MSLLELNLNIYGNEMWILYANIRILLALSSRNIE